MRSICLLLLSLPAQAAYFDLNFLSLNDSFKTSTTTVISRSMYDVGIGASMGRSDNWIWALNYGSGTFSDKATTTTTFAFTDIGIKIGYFWTKQKSWFTTVTYSREAKAKFNDGTSTIELRGTSIKADIGYVFWPADWFGVAAKIFYYAPTYTESVASGALTTVKYTRTVTYPSITLMISY